MSGAKPTRPSSASIRAAYTPLGQSAPRVTGSGAGAFACTLQSTWMGAPTGTPLISAFAYVGSVSGPLRSICTVSVLASVRTTSVA